MPLQDVYFSHFQKHTSNNQAHGIQPILKCLLLDAFYQTSTDNCNTLTKKLFRKMGTHSLKQNNLTKNPNFKDSYPTNNENLCFTHNLRARNN